MHIETHVTWSNGAAGTKKKKKRSEYTNTVTYNSNPNSLLVLAAGGVLKNFEEAFFKLLFDYGIYIYYSGIYILFLMRIFGLAFLF